MKTDKMTASDYVRFVFEDRQKVYNEDGKVEHGVSAKANIQQMGQNIKDMFRLDHVEWAWSKQSNPYIPLASLLPPGMLFFAGWELSDIVVNPLVRVPANGVQAMYHGVRALFQD